MAIRLRNWLVLVLVLLVCLRVPMVSRIDLCLKSVLSTEQVFDGANDTYIQYVPTGEKCTTPGGEAGTMFTRMQWGLFSQEER